MKVSVVIPAYNHATLIEQTLASVFAQDVAECEVIVVNDGSPDDTAAVVAPYARDGLVRYIEQPNAGQAAARNRGWREAKGTYVAFLDDDDLWPEGKLAWQIALLDSDPDAVLAYGPEEYLRPDGRIEPTHEPDRPDGDVRRAFLRRNWVLSLGQTLIRRDALERVGGLDTTIWGSDDWDLLIRLSRLGAFRYRSDVALRYRLHEQNASRQAVRHVQNHLKVVRRHIGANLPLLLAHQQLAGRYFVPNLLAAAAAARRQGDFRFSARALGYAMLFHPQVFCRPRHAASLARSLVQGVLPKPRHT